MSAAVALADRVRPLVLAGERVLPVVAELAALTPFGGLRRGSVISVGASSLTFRLLAAATTSGSWAAAVGASSLGWAAAAELGVSLERVAVIATPSSDQCATVIAALVDAVEIVVVGQGVAVRAADARRLTARARERGSVLIALGAWPEAVDLRWRVTATDWDGLGNGHGCLASRRIEVEVVGRGAAARPRRAWIDLGPRALATVACAAPGVGGSEVGGSEVGGSEVGGSEVGGSEVGGSEAGVGDLGVGGRADLGRAG